MHDAIVIGSGLFGRIIAKALRADGRDVLILNREEVMAGSKPAACLMKPSWFSGMGKDVYEPSLKLLDDLYGIRDVQFTLRPKLAKATVHWIPPAEILHGPYTVANVTSIQDNVVFTGDGAALEARLIVVAAGIWTEDLLPQYDQIPQKGVAFLWGGLHLDEPFVKPWAPYRQLVGFNRGDGIWASDGTAIQWKNWTQTREEQALARCQDALEEGTARHGTVAEFESIFERRPPRKLTGIRPYAKGHKPCLLEEVRPGLWVASGGAKNGTVAAGYCAHIIREKT